MVVPLWFLWSPPGYIFSWLVMLREVARKLGRVRARAIKLLRYPRHGYRDSRADFHCTFHASAKQRHPHTSSRVKKSGEAPISGDLPATWRECALRPLSGSSGQGSALTRSSAGKTPRQHHPGPGTAPVNNGRKHLFAVAPGGR